MVEQILSLNSRTWENINSPLLHFRKNIFSQSGEDGIIEAIVNKIPEMPNFFVEFGAWDGLHLSNCAHLARALGWRGVFIEGDGEKFPALLRNYEDYPGVISLNKWVSRESGSTLDELVSPYQTDLGILSIDIDGNDYHIWESVQVLSPALVIIEINPSIPNDVKFVQQYSLEINQGSSLLAMIELANKKGYELICCTSANAFFIKKQYFNRFALSDNSANSLYVPKCDGRIFHGFDGTIFVVGMDRIIWKGISVTSDDFQISSPDQRKLT